MTFFSPLRLPVQTVSGKNLGHVVDIDVDATTHSVTGYHVKPNRLVPDMVSAPLLIRPSQVVEITAQAMIVEDASIGQTQAAPLPTT